MVTKELATKAKHKFFNISAKLGLPLFVLAIVVAWNLGFYFLSRADSIPVYNYGGTSGPFSITRGEDGNFVAGSLISMIKPGGIFGWKSTVCIRQGIPGLGVTELVKLSPGEEIIINRVETVIPASGHRCGEKVVARLVPMDAPTGYYELRRQLLLAVKGRQIAPIPLPSIHIRVSP